MSEKNMTLLSSFELHQQACIERNRVIQAYLRAAVRGCAKGFRMLVLRGRRLARDLIAERRRRIAIRELRQFDDRILKDIGVRRCGIEFAVRNGLPTHVRRKSSQRHWDSAPPRHLAA